MKNDVSTNKNHNIPNYIKKALKDFKKGVNDNNDNYEVLD
jgi:hypothetical protein